MNEYKDMAEFQSQAGYLVDDVWYPRVTKIIEIKAKPALYRYYASLSSYEEGEEIKKQSATEGTLVHEALQGLLLGKSVTVSPTIAPAIETAMDFIRHHNIQIDPEYVERRIVSQEHRYSGTIDSLALIDGKYAILDIKTSQAIYRDYCLQTAAYMEALQDDFHGISTRFILRVDQATSCIRCGAMMRIKGGREKVKEPYPRGYNFRMCREGEHEWRPMRGIVEMKELPSFEADLKAFLGAKTLWEWEHGIWLRKIGYL
ncbi:MAG: hypothetical protein FJY91_01305 [Candidatus Harrisonbacteria bacterium]|nr:hypothetical protein [Candidatus Harrisonbacteria bacterium]